MYFRLSIELFWALYKSVTHKYEVPWGRWCTEQTPKICFRRVGSIFYWKWSDFIRSTTVPDDMTWYTNVMFVTLIFPAAHPIRLISLYLISTSLSDRIFREQQLHMGAINEPVHETFRSSSFSRMRVRTVLHIRRIDVNTIERSQMLNLSFLATWPSFLAKCLWYTMMCLRCYVWSSHLRFRLRGTCSIIIHEPRRDLKPTSFLSARPAVERNDITSKFEAYRER